MALHLNKYRYQFHVNPCLFTNLLTNTKFRPNVFNGLLPYCRNFHSYRPIIVSSSSSISSSSSGARGGATNRKVAGSIPGGVIRFLFFSFT